MAQIPEIGLIGFGEAGSTFLDAGGWASTALVYDRLTGDEVTREAKINHYERLSARGCGTLQEVVESRTLLCSLVTADQAHDVAVQVSKLLTANSLFLDFNSVSPETKKRSEKAITEAGGCYVDVAVMAPVQPAHMAVPLLVSGLEAQKAGDILTALGFKNVRMVGSEVGRASSIKMIRSVMVKGLEALTTECVLAAYQAGVLDEVLGSLDASWPGADWRARADYNLDRMMVHGTRRSAEMAEVVRTLDDLGTGSDMSRGTVARQARIGALDLKIPPQDLSEKITAVLPERASHQ